MRHLSPTTPAGTVQAAVREAGAAAALHLAPQGFASAVYPHAGVVRRDARLARVIRQRSAVEVDALEGRPVLRLERVDEQHHAAAGGGVEVVPGVARRRLTRSLDPRQRAILGAAAA